MMKTTQYPSVVEKNAHILKLPSCWVGAGPSVCLRVCDSAFQSYTIQMEHEFLRRYLHRSSLIVSQISTTSNSYQDLILHWHSVLWVLVENSSLFTNHYK